jgi:hypothetical protein
MPARTDLASASDNPSVAAEHPGVTLPPTCTSCTSLAPTELDSSTMTRHCTRSLPFPQRGRLCPGPNRAPTFRTVSCSISGQNKNTFAQKWGISAGFGPAPGWAAGSGTAANARVPAPPSLRIHNYEAHAATIDALAVHCLCPRRSRVFWYWRGAVRLRRATRRSRLNFRPSRLHAARRWRVLNFVPSAIRQRMVRPSPVGMGWRPCSGQSTPPTSRLIRKPGSAVGRLQHSAARHSPPPSCGAGRMEGVVGSL